MKVCLEEIASKESIRALISEAHPKELPMRKDGWQFTWKTLGRTEGADFYKMTKVDSPTEIEGMLMLTILNEEMLYMNNIEVAPHNYGSKGKYDRVAGCLIAFACHKSFELGKNAYKGYLSFDSKTELVKLYEKKYGATHAIGHKMFFDPKAGKRLIDLYLSIDL